MAAPAYTLIAARLPAAIACAAGGRVAGSIRNGSGLWKLRWKTWSIGEGEEVGHRVAGHLDPDRVDQHDAADPRRLRQRDLRGDPASDGVADNSDILKVELVQQRVVQRGQAADRVQRLGPRSAAEAGVGRDERAHIVSGGEQLGEPCHRCRARPAVQEQERLPGPVVGDGHLDLAGTGQVHGVNGGVHGTLLVACSMGPIGAGRMELRRC